MAFDPICAILSCLQDSGRVMDLPLALIINQKGETKGKTEVRVFPLNTQARLLFRFSNVNTLLLFNNCRAVHCLYFVRIYEQCSSRSSLRRALLRYAQDDSGNWNLTSLPYIQSRSGALWWQKPIKTKKWIKQNIFPPKVTAMFAFKNGEQAGLASSQEKANPYFYDVAKVNHNPHTESLARPLI